MFSETSTVTRATQYKVPEGIYNKESLCLAEIRTKNIVNASRLLQFGTYTGRSMVYGLYLSGLCQEGHIRLQRRSDVQSCTVVSVEEGET
jgi:hypothetical protein